MPFVLKDFCLQISSRVRVYRVLFGGASVELEHGEIQCNAPVAELLMTRSVLFGSTSPATSGRYLASIKKEARRKSPSGSQWADVVIQSGETWGSLSCWTS
jgi:hypothetical protein